MGLLTEGLEEEEGFKDVLCSLNKVVTVGFFFFKFS